MYCKQSDHHTDLLIGCCCDTKCCGQDVMHNWNESGMTVMKMIIDLFSVRGMC